jgi:hypothetical protein
MNLQQFFTPFVLVSLLIGQGYLPASAQEPIQQPATQPAQQTVQPGLNNEAIIKLVKAGLSDDLIVATIGSSPGAYDISADGMIALKTAGVSDRVVAAVVSKINAAAQLANPVPSLPPMPPAATGKVLLKEGSDVMLTLDEDITSKTSQQGDLVTLILTEDLKVGDVIVARTGAKAMGEIISADKSEMMGKGGELSLRLDYLKVGNEKIHLRGNKTAGGKDSVGGMVGLMMICFVCGILHHGKESKILKGTPVHAYVSEDISLPPAI